MGLFFRPRRPLARLAAEAAITGLAHHYGTSAAGTTDPGADATTYTPPTTSPPGPSPSNEWVR